MDAAQAKLATYAAAFDHLWPFNRKRVFGACCEAVVWDRKRDGLDIRLIPHSALDDDGPSGSITQ